jgi:Tfp pilus assembly protein PilF
MKYIFDRNFIVTGAFLLFSLISVGCTTTDNINSRALNTKPIESKTEMIALAKTQEQDNQLEKAIFYYIQALEVDNQDVDVFCQIGNLQNRLHNPDLANRAYKRALEINPHYIPVLAQMGIYYLEQQMLGKASEFLKRTVLLDQQRLNNKDIDSALVELDQISPLLAYNAYAVVNDLDNRHEYAREIFNLLLKRHENESLIFTNLGYSYYLTNNYVLAQSNYKKALDVNPSFEQAKLNLGLIYVRNGQYSKAVQLFKQVMTYAQAYNDIGYFLMLDGRYKEAEYFLQTAIDYSPSYYVKGNINLDNVQIYLNAEN